MALATVAVSFLLTHARRLPKHFFVIVDYSRHLLLTREMLPCPSAGYYDIVTQTETGSLLFFFLRLWIFCEYCVRFWQELKVGRLANSLNSFTYIGPPTLRVNAFQI